MSTHDYEFPRPPAQLSDLLRQRNVVKSLPLPAERTVVDGTLVSSAFAAALQAVANFGRPN